MLEMTSLSPTLQINESLNIRARLRQQRHWQTDWEAKDQALEQVILSVDDRTAQGEQIGLQATSERIRTRLALIREPLEIDVATIERTGYGTLRRMLDSQFAALSADERKQWLWNFLFIMTPDLRRLYDKIARVRSYRALGQQRNFWFSGQVRGSPHR